MARDAAANRRVRARDVLLLALCGGLLGGLAEATIGVAARFGFGRLLFRGLDLLWMAPLSLGAVGLCLSLPLALLATARPGPRIDRAAWSGFVLLVLLNLTPTIPRVHGAARLLLLAGIAVALGRLVWPWHDRLLLLARRSVVPLLALVVLLGVGVRAGRAIQERRAIAALGEARAAAPSILLVILDTVRAMDLELYGYARTTAPALRALAGRGVVFERAYAPSSWTLTSHAAMFTGRRPFETGVSWKVPLDARYPTLAEALSRRGYVTAGFSANPYYVTRESGLARGFAHFDDRLLTPASALLSSSLATAIATPLRHALGWHGAPDRKTAGRIREELLRWLARRPPGRPLFLFANLFDAHAPYLPPAPFDTAFTGRRIPWKERNPELELSRATTREASAMERAVYDQAVAAQDRELGALLAELERLGFLRNTLVVVTSDHGEEFGEWGMLSHGNSLNPAALWVPLVIARPNDSLPARLARPVSLVDLPATILTLADSTRTLELPGHPLLGRGEVREPSLRSAVVAELEYAPDMPDWIPRSNGPLRSLTLDDWHYLRETGGLERLLSLAADPAGRLADVNGSGMRTLLDSARTTLDSFKPATRALPTRLTLARP